ncbi:MAG: type II secretion system protein GspM [Pseudomonadota bacterium]
MKEWFFGLQARERMLVSLGSLVVIATVLYVAIWEPIQTGHAIASEDVARKSDLVARARAMAPVSGASNTPKTSNSSLVVTVSNSAYANGLANAYRNSSPIGNNGLRVALENASFDTLVVWLAALEREHGIAIESSSVTRRRDVGRVDASIVLTRIR